MYLLLVKNYKKNIYIMALAFILLVTAVIISKIVLTKTADYVVMVNEYLSVSYPMSLTISDIYSKNDETVPYIQASNDSYKSFLNYKCPEQGIEFSYPGIFEINESNFPGSEILCHINFKSKENTLKNGFIQVWNLPFSLEDFLKKSKETAMVNFTDFKSEKIVVNNIEGYLWDYSFNSDSGKYKALEAFLSKNSKLYRISYFIPQNEYGTDDYNIFMGIVNSLKITG
ncbi:hypothetical protein LY28_02660 [Ruminiclostridium sufflavum DSM 19573]|uniref:PsbP protein n=1 Tax=Ruminiclostridium sufflavum DSM 19573 TaxID=1121337 RepID=A0A318XI00_9FIRM|nr:hypothetical protein [Ruminiclostridium sufflavum]PYG86840.1 hypothetical protein LY28_02660 [Ruminiclostridium sufflavum DSM 19573]